MNKERLLHLLTTKEVANELRVSTHYVTKLRKSGLLVGTRIGKRWMYDAEALEYFIKKVTGKDLSNFSDMTPDAVAKEYLN